MRVLIIGAGPTGAALSLLLARHGIDVTVFEKEDDLGREFRGEALMPSGVDAISQMGLCEQFDALPLRRVECMEFFVEGDRVLRADWPEVAGENGAHLVAQPPLLEMLTGAAAKFPTFRLRMGAAVRKASVSQNSVELQVDTANGRELVRGDFLIGADGRGSTVRTQAGLTIERLPFPFDVLWFSLPMPPDQRADPRFQAFSRRGASVAWYPSWDDKLRVGFSPSAGLRGWTKASVLEAVARTVDEGSANFVRAHTSDATDPVKLKVLFGRCAVWTAARTLLLGDAAHPMSPVRAQGINLAFRDAIVAANHLVPVIKRGTGDLEQAARAIQQEREPEIIESQRLQLASAAPPPPARSALFRGTVLPVLRRLGIVKRVFLKAEIPLRHGVVPVQLSV